MRRRWPHAFALALLFPACVLVDTGELAIEPPGTLLGGRFVELSVVGPPGRVGFDVSGQLLPGAYPSRTHLIIAIPEGVPDGEHILRARALDGSLTRTIERKLIVRRGQELLETVVPAPGRYAASDPVTDAPLVVEIRFARPVAAARVGPASVGFEGEASTVSILPDGRTLRVTAARSLDLSKSAVLDLAADVIEPPAPSPWRLRWERIPGTAAYFRWRTESKATNGAVALQLERTGGPQPPWIDLFANEISIGRVTAATDWSLVWDTRPVPEGVYTIEAVAEEGYELGMGYGSPSITVDRTPPVLTACTEEQWPYPETLRMRCFQTEFSEVATISSATLAYGDDRAPATYYNRLVCPTWLTTEAPLWPTQRLDGIATDMAGNEADVSCLRPTPLFRDEYPVPPPGPFARVDADLPTACADFPNLDGDPAGLVAIRGGAVEQGLLAAWYPTWGGGWSDFRELTTAGTVATDLAGRSWIETTGGGPGQVFVFNWWADGKVGPRNRDPERDARDATSLTTERFSYFAWSEATADGRSVFVSSHGDPPAPPQGGSADQPALGQDPRAGQGDGRLLLAWIERSAGETAALRMAAWSASASAWELLPSASNGDPALDAAEPTVWSYGGECAVAWTEGGRVLLRRAGSDFSFGPAEVVNADPDSQARAPRLDPLVKIPVLYWLERATSGDDLLVARRWNGSSWALIPGPAVNAGVVGEVRDYSVTGGVIAWVAADGELHLRRTDCF